VAGGLAGRLAHGADERRDHNVVAAPKAHGASARLATLDALAGRHGGRRAAAAAAAAALALVAGAPHAANLPVARQRVAADRQRNRGRRLVRRDEAAAEVMREDEDVVAASTPLPVRLAALESAIVRRREVCVLPVAVAASAPGSPSQQMAHSAVAGSVEAGLGGSGSSTSSSALAPSPPLDGFASSQVRTER